MKKTKRIISFFVGLCACLNMNVAAFALENETHYNPVLEELGISEEMFLEWPKEKRAFYQDIVAINDSVSETKYFKEVFVSSYAEEEESTPVLVEVDRTEYEMGISGNLLTTAAEDTKQIEGSWYAMTTTLKTVDALNGARKYVVVNTLDIDKKLFNSINRSGYLGVSVNSNTSPLSGSEFMRLSYTLGVSGQSDVETYNEAQHKYDGGYAFDFEIGGMMVSAQISMTFEIEPTVNGVRLLDGFGFAGYWNSVVVPTISIGSGGASLDITPQKGLVMSNNTHVQIAI